MCRTFSLPEVKQSGKFVMCLLFWTFVLPLLNPCTDIFGAVKALERPVDTIADVDIGDLCWSDYDLLNLLEDVPDEIGLEADSAMSEDDSSLSYSSLSDDSVSVSGPLPTVFDMGKNFGLCSPEEGFVALPCPKSFSHVTFKTPEMVREEKLDAINPFIDSMNEGDLFSLFTICQQQCSPDVTFYSQSCGFKCAGVLPVVAFWALLFQEHYQGRIQCLERRINSNVVPKSSVPLSGAYEGVNLILKLEGCRLTPFQNFDIFRSLMNSGFVHNNLSLHEVIHLVDAFNLQHQQSTLSTFPAQQHQQQHHLYQVTYLFEVNLRFHAIHHTISSLNWEVIGVDCR